QDPLGALRRHRRVLRFRPRGPARLLRSLRRRPGQDQPHRRGVPEGHSGADPEDRERGSTARQSHGPARRGQGGGEGGGETGSEKRLLEPASGGTTMRNKAVFALPLLAMATALFAQKQAPPEPGKPKGFAVPAPRKFTLDNGLAVTLVPYGTLAQVTVRLAVRTGDIDEKRAEARLATARAPSAAQG